VTKSAGIFHHVAELMLLSVLSTLINLALPISSKQTWCP